MFGRAKNTAAPITELPAPIGVASLAGVAAYGGDGGSGMVDYWNALQHGYANETALTEMLGGQPLDVNYQGMTDPVPDSLYVSRQMRGGVRTAPSFNEYRDEVMLGGHVVMTNRPPLVLVVSDQMSPQQWVADASWRNVPDALDICRRIPGVAANVNGFAGKNGIS